MHAAPNSLAVVCLDRLTTRRRKRVWSFPLASSPTPALPDWYWAEAQDGSLDVLGCPVTMSNFHPRHRRWLCRALQLTREPRLVLGPTRGWRQLRRCHRVRSETPSTHVSDARAGAVLR